MCTQLITRPGTRYSISEQAIFIEIIDINADADAGAI